MIIETDLIPKFRPVLHEIYQYSHRVDDEFTLWELADRGGLFRAFQEFGDTNNHLSVFFQKVQDVIEKRAGVIVEKSKPYSFTGRFLMLDPSATMYDGLSEELTSGFFDSDDVPPPEFWVGVVGNKLVAFIPKKFLPVTEGAVENCMSGCLEWMGESFSYIYDGSGTKNKE
ncbi:hypothetical protein [Oceanicoccus sp. KOV_DT_Chl]|uniref:hypothetical protein n=1 Tax=Oceanicoccus sp. KOV_DT_Chl TaxID=1904639 RepID=UPI0011AF1978|nr:hypothetical protein [Oceanicoccus sp. KOV_DT_Chl]